MYYAFSSVEFACFMSTLCMCRNNSVWRQLHVQVVSTR